MKLLADLLTSSWDLVRPLSTNLWKWKHISHEIQPIITNPIIQNQSTTSRIQKLPTSPPPTVQSILVIAPRHDAPDWQQVVGGRFQNRISINKICRKSVQGPVVRSQLKLIGKKVWDTSCIQVYLLEVRLVTKRSPIEPNVRCNGRFWML